MKIFESHCHLYDEEFEKDIEEVFLRAKNNNVSDFLIVGYDLESNKKAIEFVNNHKLNYFALGINPNSKRDLNKKSLKELEEQIKKNKPTAIGEIGLDLFHSKEDKRKQIKYFVEQLKLAKKYDLPIIIHSRDSNNETYNVLKKCKNMYKKGIMHCFTYDYMSAKKYIDLGLKISISGIITYKKNEEIKEVVEKIDIENLIIETDSPYLAPVPFRGKRNEPSYLKFILEKVCEIKKLEKNKATDILYKNANEILISK